MITEVVFDVHGVNADVIQTKAIERMWEFDPTFDANNWTLTIQVMEEATTPSGVATLWRGEVTARLHGNVR